MDLVLVLARCALEILVISLVMLIYFGEMPRAAVRETTGKLDARAGEEGGRYVFLQSM